MALLLLLRSSALVARDTALLHDWCAWLATSGLAEGRPDGGCGEWPVDSWSEAARGGARQRHWEWGGSDLAAG